MSWMYALEGVMYVLYPNQSLSREDGRRNSGAQASAAKSSFILSGGGGGRAAVFGPDDKHLTEPTDPSSDTLIYQGLLDWAIL